MDKPNNTPPPWSEAPPWAKWRAQDEVGEWWWYEYKPRFNADHDGWDIVNSHDNAEQCKLTNNEHCPNWRDTLQKRPENE